MEGTPAVCIVTFRRPDLLERLLVELRPQLVAAGARAVVVDNDEARSAEPAVANAAATGVDVTYVVEPTPGIPFARNAAVRAAEGAAFIVFTDDDVRPSEGWLAALVRTQGETGSDVVTGPVRFTFPSGAPAWAAGAHCFRPRTNEAGDPATWPATNNVLIRRRAMLDRGIWFDEGYGMAGGSDTQLFRRLDDAGATFAWAEDAVVDEFVPADRATVRWVLRRSYRTGNTATLCDVELRGRRSSAPAAVKAAGRWAWWAAKSAGAAIVRRDATAAVRAGSSLARAAGLVSGLSGARYQEYGRGRAG